LAAFSLKTITTMQKLAFVAGLGASLLLGSVFVLLFTGSSGGGTVEERYVTWTDASASKLIDRGLLPSFAPRSSSEIIVRSRPATDQYRGTFRFPISDGPRMRPKLADMPASETDGAIALPQPYDEWWPLWLRGRLGAGPRGNPGYSIHRPFGADNAVEDVLVACDFTKGHCLYWSDRRPESAD
jgi:hypothetical protein